jgi:hypothetical protein
MMGARDRAMTLAVVVAPCAALLCVLSVAIAERSGGTLFAAAPPANLAEAAAMGRGDDVARRLQLGEDPFAVYDLRPEVISSAVRKATVGEAAMWSRQLLMIELLDRGDAIGDTNRLELACLALDLEVDEEIVELLSPGSSPDCVPQRARDRVLARTNSPTASNMR